MLYTFNSSSLSRVLNANPSGALLPIWLTTLLVIGTCSSAFGAPEVVAPELAAITSSSPNSEIASTLTPQVADTDREVRLRNIEDELLQKLSLGSRTDEANGTTPSLPDVHELDLKDTTQESDERGESADIEVPNSKNPARRAPQHPRSSVSKKRQVRPRIQSPSDQVGASTRDLEQRLAIAESQVSVLTKEIESARSRLAQSEAQLALVSKKAAESTVRTQLRPSEASPPDKKLLTIGLNNYPTETEGRRLSFTPTARVTKSKTPLRIGPSSNESAIMLLSIDSVVTIELRSGEWYRVITSSGARGWVAGRALMFDEGDFPGSTVRVGAYRANLEPESFQD